METIVTVTNVSEFTTLKYFDAWQGGLDTLNEAIANGKIDELDELCEQVFFGQSVSEVELNDWLWFDEEVNALVYGE